MAAGSSFAQDEDTDTSTVTSSGDEWDFRVTYRGDNALQLEPPNEENQDQYYSKLDCIKNVDLKFEVELSGTSLDRDGDVYLLRSAVDITCTNEEEFDQCESFASQPFSPTDENTSVIVSFNDLNLYDVMMDIETRDNCLNSTATLKTRLWVGILENEKDYDSESDFLDKVGLFEVDLVGPAQTTQISEILVGDDNVEVHFPGQNAAAVEGYLAIAVPVAGDDCTNGPLTANTEVDSSIAGLKSEYSASSDETSISIGGLDNGVRYQVAVATLDDHGNPSVLSAPRCAVPQESVGIGDAIETDGEYCFIATAAFCDYNHPTVKVLRTFRDQFLKDLPAGNRMVAAYYSVGPAMAAMIEDDAGARALVRSALGLFAGLTKYLVAFGPLQVMLAVFGAMLLGTILGFAAPRRRRNG